MNRTIWTSDKNKQRLAEFAAAAAKGIRMIFDRDMCVGENTNRLANADFGRFADKICAAASRSPLVGKVFDFVDEIKAPL